MYPTLFISHGAPNVVLHESKSITNFKNFSKKLQKPEFIIIFSAHYVSDTLQVINYSSDELLYDFYGFEKELYEFEFDIKSDKKITLEVMEYLKNKDIDIQLDKNRTTFDHGVWTTLSMLFEKLDIPVIQFSIPLSYSPKELIKLGEVLQYFKEKALIIGSGGITHNLREIAPFGKTKEYAQEFNNYIIDVIAKGDEEELLNSMSHKQFLKNHPSSDHFLPLFIAFGNAINKKGSSFNSEMVYTNISMESFAFDMKELV